MQKVTIGGDRLGSGNKNKIALHNYERSTHNLTTKFTSSLAPGILYPFLVLPAMRGDAFEIDLDAAARTIPTKGPLFGSFKMQVDLFQCPFRLYQAILHNNPTAIGLKMAQVKFPRLVIETVKSNPRDIEDGKFDEACLLKYLGLSGIGQAYMDAGHGANFLREVNAMPALAYYDIFKNYYSNKQEENAYVITNKEAEADMTNAKVGTETHTAHNNMVYFQGDWQTDTDIEINGAELDADKVKITLAYHGETIAAKTLSTFTSEDAFSIITEGSEQINCTMNVDTIFELYEQMPTEITITIVDAPVTDDLHLKPFLLKNIDDMRMNILSHNQLGVPYKITQDNAVYPYLALVDKDGNGKTSNKYSHNGLVIKTYQSDLFNNWVNTEWIDGDNGIAEITKIAVNDGAFKIDALNLAEKLYNMLNRVAVSGGTYEDWQDAVYTQSPRRHIESPVYLGGMSSEVMFEEIVQTSPSTATGEITELGALGGRGTLGKRKGGHVNVKVDEASFIIGIISLTPRVTYTQGNEWYMTELESMDDLHKPALDGIGFQNLLGERLAWWDTVLANNGTVISRSKIGKVPAWIEYMTNYDRAFGDFAKENSRFMILSRSYEVDERTNRIKDATTYVDPVKFNYAFAYTKLDAQNFWVQIYSEIKARRLMSAKQIPNV